jgi:hypothetical protein
MSRTKVFSGSVSDGLSMNLPEWAGVTLTEDQYDQLWGEYDERSLLELCDEAEIVIEEALEGHLPGMNDTYYSVYCNDPDRLREELRKTIMSIVEGT